MPSGKYTEDLLILSYEAGNFWKRKSASIPGLLNYLEMNASAIASTNRHCFNIVSALQHSPWPSALLVGGGGRGRGRGVKTSNLPIEQALTAKTRR
jgi:hypothetical protein